MDLPAPAPSAHAVPDAADVFDLAITPPPGRRAELPLESPAARAIVTAATGAALDTAHATPTRGTAAAHDREGAGPAMGATQGAAARALEQDPAPRPAPTSGRAPAPLPAPTPARAVAASASRATVVLILVALGSIALGLLAVWILRRS